MSSSGWRKFCDEDMCYDEEVMFERQLIVDLEVLERTIDSVESDFREEFPK